MKNIKKAASFFAAALCASSLFAAGYQIQEQGASNQGTSNAGAVVNANNDASAAFWNPSAVSFMDMEAGKTLVNAAITMIIPTLGMSSDKPGQGNADCGVNAYVPNFFLVHKFTEEIAATLSVSAPFGLESEYDKNWYGAAQGVHSFLFTTDVNPSLTYKVTDWFSISGGVSAQYAYCKLTQNLFGNDIDFRGQGWGVGGNVGFTVNYMEGGKFGFNWRSQVSHTLNGNYRLNGNVVRAITADMYMPDTFNVGVYQRLGGDFREFAVMVDYVYTMWSCFENLTISGFPPVQENWKDTSKVAFGVHYYPEEIKDLTIRFGVAFDESPVKSAELRTVRIPCSDRVWFSGGVGYKWEDFSFDFAYSYIMTVGSSTINRTEYGVNMSGHYYGHIHVLSFQFGYEF